jgi:hypothetical protein
MPKPSRKLKQPVVVSVDAPISAELRLRFETSVHDWREKDPGVDSPPWVYVDESAAADATDFRARLVAVDMVRPAPKAELEPWLVRGLLRPSPKAGLVLSSVLVEHLLDDRVEVTNDVLHRVKAATIRDLARASLHTRSAAIAALNAVGEPVPEAVVALSGRLKAELDAKEMHQEAVDREIALACIERFKAGSRSVVSTLAKERGIRYETFRDQVARARDRGYLLKVKQGQSFFVAGPRLGASSEVATPPVVDDRPRPRSVTVSE